METTKLSLAEQLKMELMERYNLREDQVRLELAIHTTDLKLGREILADFDKYKSKIEHLREEQTCGYVKSEHLDLVWVHRRDGFLGRYVNETEGEEDEC